MVHDITAAKKIKDAWQWHYSHGAAMLPRTLSAFPGTAHAVAEVIPELLQKLAGVVFCFPTLNLFI